MSAPPEKCPFDRAWMSRCGEPAAPGSSFCEKHAAWRCQACGKPAVKDCGETYQFVCGTPLCAACECPCQAALDAEAVARALMREPGGRSPV